MSWNWKGPVLCLVTDRSRLNSGNRDTLESLLDLVVMAAKAGVDIIQIREPDLSDRVLQDFVRLAVKDTSQTGARIIVNDRLDIALMAGAAGLHLRSDSLPASRARALAPSGWLIGRSIHSAKEALQVNISGGVDYLMFGTVFDSTSKPNRAGVGIEALKQTVHSVELPIIAIGGMTGDRVRNVAKCGASGLAAISFFVDSAKPDYESFKRTISQMRQTFELGIQKKL